MMAVQIRMMLVKLRLVLFPLISDKTRDLIKVTLAASNLHFLMVSYFPQTDPCLTCFLFVCITIQLLL
jgi:hypothetical protein